MILVPLFDLKFLNAFAAGGASNSAALAEAPHGPAAIEAAGHVALYRAR